MRKQTKLVAALSATALLAIGASAVSFAAGWNNTTGNWQYLDNDGNPIADAWRKSGDYWFYLGSDGNMVTNEVVQNNNDFYYVNQDGAMVTNQWVAFDVDSDNGDADHRWMYFGADGKAYRDTNDKLTISDIRTINGKKYVFDREGYMLYGWLGGEPVLVSGDSAWEDAKYYYGGFDDGSAQHGWVQLSVLKNGDETTAWFYFDDNGEITKNTRKTINGATYYFGQDGRMIEDWSNAKKMGVGSGSVMQEADASSNNIVYVNGDGGARKNQWIWAVPSEKLNPGDFEDDNYSWWWADASGKIAKNTIKRIRNKIYAFDELGRMVSGLQKSPDGRKDFEKIDADNLTAYFNKVGVSDNVYYFSGDSEKDGSRKSGLQTISFDDGDYQFYFQNNGKAAHGYITRLRKYVNRGVVLAADNDESNYGYVVTGATTKEIPATTTEVKYFDGSAIPATAVLVNTTGTVQKSKFNLKDINDVYYVTDGEGKILYASYKKLYTTSSSDHNTGVTIGTKTYYTE